MLKALYDYSVRNGLTLPPGFDKEQIRAYISLTASGDFLGIEQCTDELLLCPDIGSKANGNKCNVLAEKIEIILFDSEKASKPSTRFKHEFFCRTLQDAAKEVPLLSVCSVFLRDSAKVQAAKDEISRLKMKPSDRITFKVSGIPIVIAEGIMPWWQDYRKQFETKSGETRCLITGELTSPPTTVPSVNGLLPVGGISSGDTLICFDKRAFRSYGLKQVANAPVSEEAFAGVKAALDDLLPDSPIFAGMRFVHWYDQPLTPREDILLPDFCDLELDDELDDEEAVPDRLAEQQNAIIAKAAADALIKSIKTGETPPPLHNRYHILLISAYSGRVMVRRYEQGNYADLQKHLEQWNKDLALCDNLGTGTLRPRKLNARLFRLLPNYYSIQKQYGLKKPTKDKKRKREAALANLAPAIVMAIINGTPLPDAVAWRALENIRSQMLSHEEDDTYNFLPDGICCQWLKVWLLRKARARNEEVPLMPYYDPNFPNAAYHFGAVVAVFADLQRAAMPKIKADIVQRYYASASRTPKSVLGLLENQAKNHFPKLNKQQREFYTSRLSEPYCFFTYDALESMPACLSLEDQTYFAIGYRQMSARLVADRKKAAADKNAAAQAAETTEQEEK